MEEAELAELASLHADALKEGRDIGQELIAAHPAERPLLAELFNVAARLKSALVPLDPRTDFVIGLKRQLIREASAVERRHRNEQLIWLAIGAGSVVYALGLVALSVRSALWLLALAGLLLGWRKRPGLARARQPVQPS